MKKEPDTKKEMTAKCDALAQELRELVEALEANRENLDLWDTIIGTVFPLQSVSFGDVTGERGSHLIVDLNKLSEAHNQWFKASETDK